MFSICLYMIMFVFCVYVYLLDLSYTYERKRAAFAFLNLTWLHLTSCPTTAFIHLQTTWLQKLHFIYILYNIYVYIIHTHTHTHTHTYIYTYIFLIQSSVVGHLGCLHSLTIVNSAAIKHWCASVSIVSWLKRHRIYAQEKYHWIIQQF
jgi:hypothetical protein